MGKFATLLNCIDGRVQMPAIEYTKNRFNVSYVDSVTELGMNLLLADRTNMSAVRSVLKKVGISLNRHKSRGIVIAGHYDCAANPNPKSVQVKHIEESVKYIKTRFPDLDVDGIWINGRGAVEPVVIN